MTSHSAGEVRRSPAELKLWLQNLRHGYAPPALELVGSYVTGLEKLCDDYDQLKAQRDQAVELLAGAIAEWDSTNDQARAFTSEWFAKARALLSQEPRT